MKKSEHKLFKELSLGVFGDERAYRKILKHGYRYVNKDATCLLVQHFTEQQLLDTLVKALETKIKQAEKLKESSENAKTEES